MSILPNSPCDLPISRRQRSLRLLLQRDAAAAPRIGLLLAASITLIFAACSSPSAKAQGITFAFGPTGFGSNVCPQGQTTPSPCYQMGTLTYNVAAFTTIGNIEVLTQGAPELDFHYTRPFLPGANTCVFPQIYLSATTCTVIVTFVPLAPGLRSGAVQILDNSGNLLATTNLNGIGIAPEIAFSPAPQAPIGSGFTAPTGVAVDSSSNVFVADSSGKVYEVLAAGGYTTVNSLGGSFTFTAPGGIALDGSGNVFVTDSGAAHVYEILANGGYTTVRTLAPAFTFGGPSGVAVDGLGNVFVADYLNRAVYEILGSGGYTTVNTLGNGFSFGAPVGVAVSLDSGAEANIFVADSSNGKVYEIAQPAYTAVTSVGSGFSQPLGVAVNASGNILVTDGGFDTVLEVLASGTVVPLGSGFIAPHGLALDGSGNVYVSDAGNATVKVIYRSRPPFLSFIPTNIGSTSIDSPKSIQFENIGNEPLTGTGALSDYLDFTVVAGPGIVPDCNPGTLSLASGAQCNLSFSFTPQSGGPLTSTLTLSDNSLNGNPSTQAIQLSGTGIAPPQISGISPNYGGPSALIEVSGTNFGATQGNGRVTVGGASAYVASWSNTEIAILVPSNATTGNLVVTAGGKASNGVPFTFYPHPAITGFSPSGGAVGTSVTITGTGLVDGEGNGVVTFNGAPATIISQGIAAYSHAAAALGRPETIPGASNSIQVEVPAGATTGPISVHANGVTVYSSTSFDVSGLIPHITSISPNYGAPAAPIAISGTNFGAIQGGGSVTIGGAPSHVVSWSNTAIVIQVPSAATTGNLVVTAGGGPSNGVAFTFYSYPVITGFSTASAAVGSPVTINGTSLLDGGGDTTISFNGTPATILTQTSTSIMVDVPAGATTGPVRVHANGVTVESPANFTVAGLPVPAISGISPNYGAPSAVINIAGTNFGATQGSGIVTIGGAPSEVTAWSNTAITVRVPSAAATGNLIVMAGGGASNGAAFTFYPYPSIIGLSAVSGPVGTPLTITGTSLMDGDGNGSVTFNGTPAAIVSQSSTNIQVDVPAGAITGPIRVHANGVTVTSSFNFTVTAGGSVSDIREALVPYSNLNPSDTVTVTWNVAFPDTNYTAVCTTETVPSDFLLPAIAGRSAGSMHVNPSNGGSPSGTLHCLAVPDSDTSDIRHARQTFSGFPGAVSLSWNSAFSDTSYTAVCTVETEGPLGGGFTGVISALSTTGVSMTNDGFETGTMHCLGLPDSDSSSMRHARVAIAGSPSTVSVTWNTAFSDANYAAACTNVQIGATGSDAALAISSGSRSAASMTVINEIDTATLHCLAVPATP